MIIDVVTTWIERRDMLILSEYLPAHTDPCCVTCTVVCKKMSGGQFFMGDSIELRGAKVPKAADVVIVLEHGSCNSVIVERLRDVLVSMEKAFKAAGQWLSQYAAIISHCWRRDSHQGPGANINNAVLRTHYGPLVSSVTPDGQ